MQQETSKSTNPKKTVQKKLIHNAMMIEKRIVIDRDGLVLGKMKEYSRGGSGDANNGVDDREKAVNISKDNLEADTSSYHCNIIRQIPLESIDMSFAVEFYYQDKDDFDDLCLQASKLAAEANGAPPFLVTQTPNLSISSSNIRAQDTNTIDVPDDVEGFT
nr:cysteine protease ATG4-like isoform X1 [Tanacetum cinerariifolium]